MPCRRGNARTRSRQYSQGENTSFTQTTCWPTAKLIAQSIPEWEHSSCHDVAAPPTRAFRADELLVILLVERGWRTYAPSANDCTPEANHVESSSRAAGARAGGICRHQPGRCAILSG